MFIELKFPCNPLLPLSQHIAKGVNCPHRPRAPGTPPPPTLPPLRAVREVPPPGLCLHLEVGGAHTGCGEEIPDTWPPLPREWTERRAGRLSSGRLGNTSAPPPTRIEGFRDLSKTLELAAVTANTPRSPELCP